MTYEEYKNTLDSYETEHDLDDIEIFYDVDMEDKLSPEDINIRIIEHRGDNIIDEFTKEELAGFRKEIFHQGEKEALVYV